MRTPGGGKCSRVLERPAVIDVDGFRPCVGIILTRGDGKLLWAKRIGHDAWQFPQGGIDRGESPRQALYRELSEELGLDARDVQFLGGTRGWLRYRLPSRFVRRGQNPLCIGQKQKWFMLRFLGTDDAVTLDAHPVPEFEGWRWVNYWSPLREVVPFKRTVYRRALVELAPLLGSNVPPMPRQLRQSRSTD